MGRLRTKCNYENLRNSCILENKARLASLGLQKTISELRSITSSAKATKTRVRKYSKVYYSSTLLRRSSRLNEISGNSTPLLKGSIDLFEDGDSKDRSRKKPANTPLPRERDSSVSRLPPDALARRCASKGRGSLYHPIYGICCHFCRQKKLCGEEDCKRCGDLDISQPCIGKTDCSVCHSSTGVFCRACLLVRYGEGIDDVRTNKHWMCPHCIEEKGLRPYWICNSSLCLRKRKMAPTGVTIFKAKERGYESAAHLLMEELRSADKGRLLEAPTSKQQKELR